MLNLKVCVISLKFTKDGKHSLETEGYYKYQAILEYPDEVYESQI